MVRRIILFLALLGITVFAMGRIIPAQDETLVRIYRCGVCKAFFLEKLGSSEVSFGCAVYHSPGSCCHEGDEVVSAGTVQNVHYVLALARKGLIVTWSAADNGVEDEDARTLPAEAEGKDGEKGK